MASTFHGGIDFRLPKYDHSSQATKLQGTHELVYELNESALEVGCKVAGGEVIGTYGSNILRSSLSGEVSALEKKGDRLRLTILTDPVDRPAQLSPFGKRKGHTLAEASPEELLAEIEASGIIEQDGLTLSEHLHRALAYPQGKIQLAAVCCFDLDPLCVTNLTLTEERAAAVAGGLTILLRLLRLKEGAMLCDRSARATINAAETACADSSLIAIELVRNRYPQANQRLLTRWLMEKEMSPSKVPEDTGLFLTDAETCASLYRFFAEGYPERFKRLTVFSEGSASVYDLPHGLPLSELIQQGILPSPRDNESICRGAMDGRPLPERVDSTLHSIALLPNAVDTHSLLPDSTQPSESILTKFKNKRYSECISCGRCANVCPMYLLPYDYLPKKKLQKLFVGSCNATDGDTCIACGCCSYICPAGLPLRSAVLASAHKEDPNEG